MREEIEKSLDEVFKNIEPSQNDVDSNDNLETQIANQNEIATNNIKYRNELFEKLEYLKELGFNVEYNDKMTNDELENIINSINY